MQPVLNGMVFIVDDDVSVREALAWLLRSRRLPSEAFESAEAFEAMLARPGAGLGRQPACLMLDVRMPGLSGLALFDRLLERGLAQNENALQAIGYRQVVEHLRGERSLAETIALVKSRTRKFAKRQMTWFRGQMRLEWIEVKPDASPELAAALVKARSGA